MSQNLRFFAIFLDILPKCEFFGIDKNFWAQNFLVKDIYSHKLFLYYWPKSAIMTLKIRPIFDKIVFFLNHLFLGIKFRGLAKISDKKKKCQKFLFQKIFSQKNISFVYFVPKDKEIFDVRKIHQKIPRLNIKKKLSMFEKFSTFPAKFLNFVCQNKLCIIDFSWPFIVYFYNYPQ